ncbi:hypothetical protein L6452_02254 [Arctium lappa]|uniref:Uncharacterized protein n=1 Tax=Arctium lappa TaxID=4217 RepID=A0ACB9FIC6_ARCLA|nr:hypothetical protein L6452_02254 [Arctium lappa]
MDNFVDIKTLATASTSAVTKDQIQTPAEAIKENTKTIKCLGEIINQKFTETTTFASTSERVLTKLRSDIKDMVFSLQRHLSLRPITNFLLLHTTSQGLRCTKTIKNNIALMRFKCDVEVKKATLATEDILVMIEHNIKSNLKPRGQKRKAHVSCQADAQEKI